MDNKEVCVLEILTTDGDLVHLDYPSLEAASNAAQFLKSTRPINLESLTITDTVYSDRELKETLQ
jgi:hypothetical protein